MLPNGQVGSLRGTLLADIYDPITKVKLLEKGQEITISPGNMSHDMRKHYWLRPEELLQHVVKFKFFPKGLKDKPRFPTFVCIRSKEDM